MRGLWQVGTAMRQAGSEAGTRENPRTALKDSQRRRQVLQHRWWGVLGIAQQKAVANIILHSDVGADLFTCFLEPVVAIAGWSHL